MANPIKTSLQNFKIYNTANGGNAMVGVSHIQLPNIQNVSEVLKGSGIAGEVDVPIIGHTQNKTVTLSFFTLTEDAVSLYAQTDLSLNCRATLQSYEPSGANFGLVPERVVINGFPRNLNLSRWEVGSKGDMVVVELNVHYLAAWLNGIKVLEIDPFGSVHSVNGTDFLAPMRSLL